MDLLVDLPALQGRDGIVQDIFYSLKEDKELTFHIDWYYLAKDTDSLRVIAAQSDAIRLPAAKNTHRLHYDKDFIVKDIDPGFAAAMKRTEGLLPSGRYSCNVLVVSGIDTLTDMRFTKLVDALIPSTAAFQQHILDIMQGAATGKRPLNERSLSQLKDSNKDKGASILKRSDRKLERYLSGKGLYHHTSDEGGTEKLSFYSDSFFMGGISLGKEASFSNSYQEQKQKLRSFSSDVTNTGLEGMESLRSQFRKIGERQEQEKELTGNIFLGGSTSNGQEPNSLQDDRYYELGGDLMLPVMGIPVQLSGFYTSQDRGRVAKASYFRISYDAAKAKEQLAELIEAFSGQYDHVRSKSTSYGMVYQQYIQGLQTEKGALLKQMKGQLGELGGMEDTDISTLSEEKLQQLLATRLQDIEEKAKEKADSTGDAMAAKAYADSLRTEATAKYEQAMTQYEKLKGYEQKIDHYSRLLDQYGKMVHYDSLTAYAKVKDLEDIEHMSARDMAKKAGALLPEGKTRSFMTGLTNLDIGMLNNYVSDYTQSGQMMKGLDVGYDIGPAKIGASYGNTEYIGRGGEVEQYKILGLRSMFKPVKRQNIGLIYYNYAPARNMFRDTSFFKPAYFSISSFNKPTHILSLTYNGELGKTIRTVGEYAFSNEQHRNPEQQDPHDNMIRRSAYNFGIEATVPRTDININAAYEYVGKDFENNTMPVLMAGTQRAKVGGDGLFFNSFLKLGVEYHYLLQSNFTNTGRNNKWGFTVATRSKRYPSTSLSYKPFATFRTFDDTLQVQQKPVLGEVWTGKLNYQFKRKHYSLRFTLVGNKNNSILDTLKYSSTMLQFATIYTRAKTNLSANVAYSGVNSGMEQVLYPAFNNTVNVGLSGGRELKAISLNAGVDMGFNGSGVCKYGMGLNAFYRFRELPLSLRANCRLMEFKLSPAEPWTSLVFAGLTANWQLKMKLSN